MLVHSKKNAILKVDFENGYIESFDLNGRELLTETHAPLFIIRFLDKNAKFHYFTAFDAESKLEDGNIGIYKGFSEDFEVAVKCNIDTNHFVEWSVEVTNRTDMAVEWVDLVDYNFKNFLTGRDGEGKFLLPYNEGVLFDSLEQKEKSWFSYRDPEYPSEGSYTMFPYMLSSQFMSYMIGEYGIYIGAHDSDRAPKGLDVRPKYDGATTQVRLYTGCEFGEDYKTDFPLVTDVFEGEWQDACEIYRDWFDKNLPEGVVPVEQNDKLPDWYSERPLTVLFPAKGRHDVDTNNTGGIFPYMNAMPYIDEIKKKIDTKVMALMMHWEGTAIWAPPYVWPPYGGEEPFNEFADALHKNGDLLGVYCSGLGYTIYSRIDPQYNLINEFRFNNYDKAMCVAPDQTLPLSKICTAQRAGYDICAANETGDMILNNAYEPLMKAKIDYAQIMDQNHGGSQYFCYSKDHGHPPVPGLWMTKTMQKLLSHWNELGGLRQIGCESAAAEPYLANLRYSDNRFEINFQFGTSVPAYSYIYHRYVHNFMGNQCCCFLLDSILYRISHAFLCGDDISLVIRGDGKIVSHWGRWGHDEVEDQDKTISFVATLLKFYHETGKKWLYNGKMIKPLKYEVVEGEKEVIFKKRYTGGDFFAKTVLSTAFEALDGERAQLFINHTDSDVRIKFENGVELNIPAMSIELLKI